MYYFVEDALISHFFLFGKYFTYTGKLFVFAGSRVAVWILHTRFLHDCAHLGGWISSGLSGKPVLSCFSFIIKHLLSFFLLRKINKSSFQPFEDLQLLLWKSVISMLEAN